MRLVRIILLAAAMLTLLSLGCGIEYRPGEKVAEKLFYRGIGQPWVGGEPPGWSRSLPPSTSVTSKQDWSYRFIGYFNPLEEIDMLSDSGQSLGLSTGPGSYPIFGYYYKGKLMGIFIDISSSMRVLAAAGPVG
jgi:hypothetical protein